MANLYFYKLSIKYGNKIFMPSHTFQINSSEFYSLSKGSWEKEKTLSCRWWVKCLHVKAGISIIAMN
jgi:hypothetical protein